MQAHRKGARVVVALAASFCAFFASGDVGAQNRQWNGGNPAPQSATPAPPEPCVADCYLLSSLTLRGSVSDRMTFELKGSVRAHEIQKIPLFGPPDQVQLEDVTLNGAPAQIGFEGDHYFVFTGAKTFTLGGKLRIGTDQLLAVSGSIVSVDAHLSSGRMVEGERLSGVTGAVLHFDPMKDGEAKPAAPPVFNVARALRFGRETTFVYRITASQGDDIVALHLPLRYGEKVHEVQGSTGWSASGSDLTLPVAGKEAEVTVQGTIPPHDAVQTFTPDTRPAYEWWLFEADPDHRFEAAGEAKLVETSQSPIAPTFPGARVYLLQRGQSVEVEARSLVRGETLAAVARDDRRIVAITGRGELISDETITYDNNGLEHLDVTPAGKPMFLATDKNPQRILHAKAGSREMLVPLRSGGHEMRVQSLAEASLWPLAGAVKIPATKYPLTTGYAETVVGLPEHVVPLAVTGGDRTRWGLGRGDLIACVIGIALACFGFRTKKTRAIAAVCTAGLWFVSKEAFVVAGGALFLTGAVFLASRFLRGTWLTIASGLLIVVTLFGGRHVLMSDATDEPQREMIVSHPDLPHPESAESRGDSRMRAEGGDITPVSLSFPSSERYVVASRQLVSNERPFEPRVFYATTTLLGALQVLWLGLVLLLVWSHKDQLLALKAKIADRLTRRPTAPDPTTTAEAPPF
jgi:hypothetical protein